MAEDETIEQRNTKNLKLAKMATTLASVVAAQNQMLMQITDSLGKAQLLSDPEAKDLYFTSFRKVLDETTILNSSVKELILALQDEDIAAVRAMHEE